jgi:bifunctional non-homologous end joining protein LigD
VGTGYTKDVLLDLRGRLGRIEQKASPFVDGEAPHGEGVHWVKPKLVAEIAFAEWTQNGLLRQPRFEGLRMDKKATSVKRERAKDADRVEHRSRSGTRRASPAAKTADVKAKTSLDEYARKRDFSKTSEPAPKVGKAHKGEPVFVVQEHDATRRHYDLRLEADGVLKSWAVTKEPSLDPAVKRLAVQTEDHPVEYANFHGDIPEGEYGGGHMEIWDKGTYAPADGKTVPEQMASGKLEFDLHGKKLKGKFAMVRMHGRGEGNWLLIKKKDGEARRGGATQGKEQLAKRTAGPQANAGKAREVRVSPAAKGTRKVTYSHAEKVMFPAVGITKGDVLRYYEQIADVMVPHLKDRPLTLERLPDGVNGEKAPRFWQKNTPDYYPDWIGRARLPSERGRDVNYALVNNRESLLYLVNQGAIVFHVYFSRVQNLERPDFVLFDLDPHQSTFDAAVVTAKEVRKALKTEGVEGYVKTSGKSGIHVVAPWDREGGYDGARAWAAGVAERVVAAIPDVATTERSIRARQGKLYLDVMQNALGHHAVAPYTVRPTETATVSAPLRWEELNGKLDPKKFTMDEVLKRVKRTGDLWQGLVLAGAKGK